MTSSWLSHSSRVLAASPRVLLNQVVLNHGHHGATRHFPRCVHFSHIETFDIHSIGLAKPVNKVSKDTRRAQSDRPHGTSLDPIEECYRALRRAVELSNELALGTDVVVAACPKSPRSRVCKVQPEAWLVDAGSGHDLVDFALVLDSMQLIDASHQSIVLHTANGECRPAGSIVMDIKPLGETSSALVLESTPNFLSVGLRCMEYGYSFHWPNAQNPYWVTREGEEIRCAVEHNVPFLVTSHDSPRLVAPASTSVSDDCTVCVDPAFVSGCQAPAYEGGSSLRHTICRASLPVDAKRPHAGVNRILA